MAAKYVLKKTGAGRYHFNLVASNGQVIAIESVKQNAAAPVDDQTGE